MSTHRFLWRRHASVMALAMAMAVFTTAFAGTAPTPLSGYAQPLIEQFLLRQTAGLPGKVAIRIETPRSGAVPTCENAEPFLPTGARSWGRVSVGLRCMSGRPWTRYVPAYISVISSYYVSTRQIDAGQALTSTDFTAREGDLTTLPASIIVDPAQLKGVMALNRIASGAPIRRESVRGVSILQQGQNVKIITRGQGFVISTEGKTMTDAAIGALVQVKIQGGQLTSGIVGPDGVVERAN